jgi:hypothetical protein
MAIHPAFPPSLYEILNPEYRWFPADEALRESSYKKLLPPLVHKIRQEVKEWRDTGYNGASDTRKTLLKFRFCTQIGPSAFLSNLSRTLTKQRESPTAFLGGHWNRKGKRRSFALFA